MVKDDSVSQANIDFLAQTDPAIAELIQAELQRQRDQLTLPCF